MQILGHLATACYIMYTFVCGYLVLMEIDHISAWSNSGLINRLPFDTSPLRSIDKGDFYLLMVSY